MEKKEYRTALYLRLSRDDRDAEGRKKAESDSIASQRELLCAYLREHGELRLWDIYTDDGYSGTDFQRPAFCRMMEDIKKGCVDCVLVKDLSRLGRDYIEAGRLIQRVFPALSVRFIAVTDRYDSLTADFQQKNLLLPLKNFMNDSYCRDISRKVQSGQRVKREQGLFLGAFAVYGYVKKGRNGLAVDPYAGLVVRWIFHWRSEGLSLLAISQRLETLGVLSPMEYKRFHGQRFTGGFPSRIQGGWSASAVKRILTDEVYTGTMVQGKTARINYKVKKSVEKDKKDWVRVRGTHQPLVSEESFALTQQLLQIPVRKSGDLSGGHCFSGKLFCGDCKRPMVLRKNRYGERERLFFVCQTRNKGKGCTRHCMGKEELENILLAAAGLYGQPFGKGSDMEWERGMKERSLQGDLVRQEALALRREGEAYKRAMERLEGEEDQEVFDGREREGLAKIYEEKGAFLLQASYRQERLAAKLCSRESGGKGPEAWPKKVDRGMVLALVERIEVFEGKVLSLCFRWRKEG